MRHTKRFALPLAVVLLIGFGAGTAYAAVPDAPVPVVDTIAATHITISWPSVATATYYTCKKGGVVVGTTVNCAYTFAYLTPGTEYTFAVSAHNNEGASLTDGTVTATTLSGGTTVQDSMPAGLELGINIADLFTGVSLIGKTFWPVVAVMAALGMGFWFLGKTRRIIGGRG